MATPHNVFFDLIDDGVISQEELVDMLSKWMTDEHIKDMLKSNGMWEWLDMEWLDEEE